MGGIAGFRLLGLGLNVIIDQMKSHLNIILRTWKILKPFHKDFYFQLFFIFVSQGIAISMTLVMGKFIDALVGKNIDLIIYILIALPVLRIVQAGTNYIIDSHYMKNLDQGVIQYLQEFSLKKVLSLNISQYIEDHSAVKKDVTDKGEVALKGVIEELSLTIFPIFVFITLSLVVISWYAPVVGLWCFISLAVLMLWVNYFTKYFRPFVKQNRDNWIEQTKIKVEAFQHLQLIRQLGVEDIYLKKYLSRRLEFINYHVNTWMKNVKHRNLRALSIGMSRYVALVLTVYFFSKGNLTIGAIYAIFTWSGDLYSNVGNLAGALRNLPLQILDIERYFEASIDKEPAFKESGKEKYKQGVISFENVSFKYPKGDHNVLENISFVIPENKKVAFVGHSGCGKSTIIKLLLRAYDYDSGNIKIGNTEIRDLNAVELRRNIGYVEQHVDLFDDTLRENILFGVTKGKKITNKELEEVAHKARISQFYHRLGKEKFESMIGERGIKLSGGERQRVGIARALIKKPDIFIFDEATSNLDSENETYIKEAIDEASVGKTSIIVAHRLSTIRDSDLIIVMDKGGIVGQGNHNELLETCAEYKNLVEHQMK